MEQTIPIEIVLQDPNAPIVSTSEESTDTTAGSVSVDTNTNNTTATTVAVPNTGNDTDGSSSFFNSSAATATMASIAVLILTVVAAIVLVVRKQYRRKVSESGMTRKEERAAIVTSTMAVLAITILLGQLLATAVVQPLATNAAEGADVTSSTRLDAPDKIQIVANRYDDATVIASTKAVFRATADTSFGYKIFMSMAGEDANLYLDGDETSEYYFAPTENAGLDDNSWGYSLDGKANYSAMSPAGDDIMAQQNTNPVEEDEFTVYYTIKVAKDMPFGVYKSGPNGGGISYTIEGEKGFPETLTTMQGMTSEICDATYTPNAFKADGETIEDNVPTATLTDIRDNKTYTIAKLADGKCWMTQNLDLQKEDLLAGVTLDDTNTDHPASGFVLPDSQTSGENNWDDSDDQEAAINTAHVYSPGDVGGYTARDLGNYYNWYSATAGTGAYGMNKGDVASGSICPAGWRLPNSSRYETTATDHSILMYIYKVITSPEYSYEINEDKVSYLYDDPISIVLAGAYFGQLTGVGNYSYLVTSTVDDNTSSIMPIFFGTGARPWADESMYYGHSVRCLAD